MDTNNMYGQSGRASGVAKTIILYSAIIVFFGALLGAVYWWANTKTAVEENLYVDPRTPEQMEAAYFREMEANPEDFEFDVSNPAEVEAYVGENLPEPYATGTQQNAD
ncbi:MAG TPA: hypothetical protein VGE62_03730 [Candidatus Paceibacterota bacterium]